MYDMGTILKGFEVIPPNFTVLVRICKLLREEYTDLAQITELIEIDPSLAAAIVRLSNCAYFGCPEPATSLDEAVQRIGFSEVLKLVALVSQMTLAEKQLDCYSMTPDDIWQHSLATAIFMEFLAYDVKQDPGSAYLIGLLHGIGKYPFADLIQKVKPQAVAPLKLDFAELARWERQQVGHDHAKIGATLMQNWGFPESVWMPIQNYMRPFLSSAHKRTACLLHLSCLIAPVLTDPEHFSLSELYLPPGILSACEIEMETIEGYISPAMAWLRTTSKMVSDELLSA